LVLILQGRNKAVCNDTAPGKALAQNKISRCCGKESNAGIIDVVVLKNNVAVVGKSTLGSQQGQEITGRLNMKMMVLLSAS